MHDAFSADYVSVASVDDGVWSRAVVSRLKLQNTLDRIEKVPVFYVYAYFYFADSSSCRRALLHEQCASCKALNYYVIAGTHCSGLDFMQFWHLVWID
jgi:hypothetical protein